MLEAQQKSQLYSILVSLFTEGFSLEESEEENIEVLGPEHLRTVFEA